jgi:hypothetical protein
MHQVHLDEAAGLENRLKCLAKFPHFLAPPPRGRKPVDIDATHIIDGLRDMTAYVDCYMFNRDDPEDFFVGGGATRLFVSVVDLHVLSFSGKVPRTPHDGTDAHNFMSSWTGICSAMGLYLHSVLGIWNAGQRMPTRMLCRITQILKRHLTRDRQRLGAKGGLDRGFWFWKAFIGAMALARRRFVAPYGSFASPSSSPSPTTSPASVSTGTTASFEWNSPVNDIEGLEEWYIHAIKKWSNSANVRTWEQAKTLLGNVVWPANLSSEPLAISLWNRAMEVRV